MLKRFLRRIKRQFDFMIGYLQHQSASLRNFYPCKLIGEKMNGEPYHTIILYRVLGKQDIFEITIDELLEQPHLVARFHPTEAVKFGAIAMGDSLFREHRADRQQKFEHVKLKMLSATRG